MANKRHIIHPHIERVTGITQGDINQQLNDFFLNVPKDNILYDDQDELNKGILVISNDAEDPSIYIKDNEGNIVKISGNGSKDVNTYEDALLEATSKNIGQIFYVKEETVLEDGTEYSVGPYIVIGEGEMMKLAASSPSGDVEGDVAKLKVDVNELQSNIIDVNEELDKKVEKDANSRLMTDAEGTKLAGIAEGAQVNVIEKIVVNGTEVPVVDKVATMTIDIDIPEIENKVDGRVDNAYINDIDGVKYLVLTFTEDANKEDILVDVSEMFSEQYSSGDGIDLKNMIIALKLGKNEKVLGFDADGGLIINKDFTDRVDELESDLNDVIETVINHSEKISEFKKSIPLIQEEVGTLSNTVGEQGEDIADLQNDLKDLKGKIAIKDGLVDEQISDINAKFDDYATLESVTELTEDVSANTENITILSGAVNTHDEQISGLTENVNNHTTKITEILEDVKDIGEVVVEISENVENIVSDFEKVKVIYVENYAMAIKNATNDNIGQIIHLNKDSEVEGGTVYLKGYYFVEGEGLLSFIMTSDGTQDEIERLDGAINSLREKTDTIDAYTVNGQAISQEGGVVLESNDVIMGEDMPECEYKLNMVMSDDTIMSAIRKVENSLAATVIAMTASLNDMNSQINWVVEEIESAEDVVNLFPNILYVINEPISNITFNCEGNYGYAVLLETADSIGTITFPSNFVLSNLTFDELETNTRYLLELKYNFAKWTKLKTLN